MVETTFILDIGSIAGVILFVFIILSSGILENYYSPKRSFQMSLIIILLTAFLSANLVYSVQGMRVVVAMLLLFGIFPISVGYAAVWFLASLSDTNRIQYAVFSAWFLSLATTLILRLLFGWGELGTPSIVIAVIVLSVLMSFMNAIISIYLLKKIQKYRPS
jgi:hypothetical protein